MRQKTGWTKASASFILALTLVLAGCSSGGNGNSTEGKASETASSPQASQQSASKEPNKQQTLEIDWMNYPGVIGDNSYGQKTFEEKFNIKLKKTYPIAYGDYLQKQQLQLATGDIPDVMFIFDPATLSKYASQGFLAEVPMDLIEKYAPRTKAKMDKQAPQGWYYTNVGGHNYGLPTFYFTGQFNTKQMWRTDLLKKAGIDTIPATVDEMTTAFAALKKIGITGMSSNGQSFYNAFHSTFGAYGILPPQWMLKDGNVVNGAVQPEAKESLAKLAEWYKAGYIDPDFITGKDIGAKFASGKIAFVDAADAGSLDESNPNSAISLVKASNPDGTVAFGPLPTGPQGKSGGWAWGTAGNIWAFGKQMENEPEKMQRALEIMDALQNDEEVWLPLSWGEQGVHWEFKDAAKGVEGGLMHPAPYNDNAKLQEQGLVDISTGTTFWGAQANLDIVGKYYGKEAVDRYSLFNKPVWDLFGKSDILPSSGKYWGDLTKLKTETYARIVIGDLPVSAFDDFVKQWNDKGGAELEKEANELYQSIKR